MNPQSNTPQQPISLHGIDAAVLAGGASTRMGSNKALLRPNPGGPTVIEMVVERLREASFPAPVLIANEPGEYSFLGLSIYPDDVQGVGPIGGILTALHRSEHDRVLVVACDMLALSPPLLHYMASLPSGYDALVPAWHDSEHRIRKEPLHAIFCKSALPLIERSIAAGKLKLHDLLAALDTQWVPEDEIRRLDPDLTSFRNLNTADDWERFQRGS